MNYVVNLNISNWGRNRSILGELGSKKEKENSSGFTSVGAAAPP